jgi:serine/threonine-protein kinase
MSPEQARGRATDKRADIWAFGCVLFECLTGRAAFSGDDVSDILASVLKSEPDSGRLAANLNPRVRELLHRCLQKDPQQRYRDIGDVRMEIDSLLADPARLLVRSADLAGGRSSTLPWVAGIALAILSGASAWYLKPAPLPAPRTVTRFAHELPRNVAMDTGQPVIAVSRSGDELVYATREGLYLRRMSELEARRIPGTENEATGDPFFSPNGEWIGYVSLRSGQLKKVRATGGEPVFLADVGVSGFSPFWTADGWIIFVQQPRIMRVSENGGEATVLVDVKDRVVGPILLPDGDSLVFTIGAGNRRKVAVRSLATGNQTTLFDDADSGVQFVSSGHLVYGSGNGVSARAFDVRTRAVGSRVPLVQSFFRLSVDSGPQFKVSESGTLVYLPGTLENGRTAGIPASLAIVDRRGKADVLPAEIRGYSHPRFSPDDRRIAVQITDDRGPNVWIYEIQNNVLNQLTFEGGESPIWSPDGKEITFLKDSALWTVPSDSGGPPMLLAGTKALNNRGPTSWSPDGDVVLFVSDAGIHAWTRKNGAGTAPVIVPVGAQGTPTLAEFSPDGRWLAYMLLGPNGPELHASPYPVGSGGRQRLTTSDAGIHTWIRKRPEILFVSSLNASGEGRSALASELALLSLPITTEPTLSRRNPVELFRFLRSERLFASSMRGYDVTRDGERFVVPIRQNPTTSTTASDEEPVRLNVVLNWTEELKRLAPR